MSELTDAGREARRIYMREWQRKHRAVLREKQNNYWNKIGAQMEAENAERKEQAQE
ncbi:MAG: hypothetical protein LUE06_10330 [Oscillospiraceae bacterium]|nr:hypothetical protein [Oscillospiraceae bacterium]